MEHVIQTVDLDSIAAEMEIEEGDILLKINDQEIEDVFDYRYLLKNEYIEVLIRKKSGEEWLLEIDKDYDEDLGVEFENSLMSEYRSCSNKCIFCFIDQMPPGMRETLYFKDDDSRLSFLQGNYITLTNMKDADIDRIIHMHLAPINISIQTTNPELRCMMLHNRFAGEKLKYLKKLYDGHIEMNGQIVCCKGINDKEELKRTITDLGDYLPFMRSVSVVPAGITKFREGLYPLELFSKKEAGEVIDLIESYQQGFYEHFGLHFIHASDEFYITAEREFPEEERYDGYIQLENGVGMMRLFIDDFEEALKNRIKEKKYKKLSQTLKRNITIATGRLAYSTILRMSQKVMNNYPGVQIHVLAVRNDYFGETITVSGLITGQDLVKQMIELKSQVNVGEELLIPINMLRSGEQVFLDDMTVAQVQEAVNMKVIPVDSGAKDFIDSILESDYQTKRDNGNFVYTKGYEE